MVTFSSYTPAMDRDYGKSTVGDNSTNDVGIGVGDIGMSVPMGIAAQNVQGIGAKIRSGAGSLEIGFPGVVRGQRGAHTPGMFGKDQRQAMRELAEINEVSLTTHAAYGIMGLAGMDQQGNFSKEQRKLAVDEIKRAIEFAADTALGGSVVVHTGEFQRPISEEEWARDSSGKMRFLHHGEEPERAVIRVVDDRTGQVMTQVRKNQTVERPLWLRNDKGEYTDYEGNVIGLKDRVPDYDDKTGRFLTKQYTWDDFVADARERNETNAKAVGLSVAEYKQKFYADRDKNGNFYLEPEEAFLQATLETNEGHSRGWALQYAEGFGKERETLAKLRNSLKFYEDIEKSVPEDELWRLKKEAAGISQQYAAASYVPSEFKTPSEIIKDSIRQVSKRIEFEHQASTSQQQQAEDSAITQKHVMSARKYALQESYRSYAEAGLHAFDMTKQNHLEKNPLMITMENIFPESYGAHPDELKSLILNSRKKLAERLVTERRMSEGDAKKAAESHIKATLDTGHFNMWRKYWQNDPGKSLQANDKDFSNWMLKKTEELAKDNLIGNVHLTDNFGYQDDHLSPGEGTAPVKEIAKILKKHGYKGALTVEPGADASTDLGDFWGLMKTWKLFGSPVYGAHGPSRGASPKANWGSIQYSYFGQVNPPYYVFGAYAPSQDWTLWSQVPME